MSRVDSFANHSKGGHTNYYNFKLMEARNKNVKKKSSKVIDNEDIKIVEDMLERNRRRLAKIPSSSMRSPRVNMQRKLEEKESSLSHLI